MNPQDNTMNEKPTYQLTDEEKRKRGVKVQLAVNKLERMEHHIPPRKGEHCYFKTSRPEHMMLQWDLAPAARYLCVTNQSQSCGVDFSVEEPVDTYYSHYQYHGKLESITYDHGMGPLWRVRGR
jgi:hypothetical protein